MLESGESAQIFTEGVSHFIYTCLNWLKTCPVDFTIIICWLNICFCLFFQLLYKSQIVTDTAQMRQTLADIEARHADIKKLEKSIVELHEMFLDMATLVESQVSNTF